MRPRRNSLNKRGKPVSSEKLKRQPLELREKQKKKPQKSKRKNQPELKSKAL